MLKNYSQILHLFISDKSVICFWNIWPTISIVPNIPRYIQFKRRSVLFSDTKQTNNWLILPIHASQTAWELMDRAVWGRITHCGSKDSKVALREPSFGIFLFISSCSIIDSHNTGSASSGWFPKTFALLHTLALRSSTWLSLSNKYILELLRL